MWSWLRNRRFIGYKFRRQVPIGHYIVDFYCAELKLVIELDGTHHRSPGTDEYDDRRTAYLRRRSLHMLRIPNEQLIRDSEIVVEMIQAAIDQCLRSREHRPLIRLRHLLPQLKSAGGEGLSTGGRCRE